MCFIQPDDTGGSYLCTDEFKYESPTKNKVAVFSNKRPIGLIAPLSNNTLSMIYSPMNTK